MAMNNNIMDHEEKLSDEADQAMRSYASKSGMKAKCDWVVTNGRLGEDSDLDKFDEKRVQYYSDNAEHWDHDQVVHENTGNRVGAQLLHKYLNGGYNARILDIGGGTGLCMKELKAIGPYRNTVGLDPAKGMLDVGVTEGRYSETLNQFFHVDSGLATDSFDIISCIAAFVPGHLKSCSIKEMVKVVKPGGYIIVVMRHSLLTSDPEIRNITPLVEEMNNSRELEVIEDRIYENYYSGLPGHIFVFRKPQ